MNDAMTAANGSEQKDTEAQDFVEMGSVSEDTKGGVNGQDYDGMFGWYA